jgi:DNA-directed RNA polymerase beta subunit
MSEELLVPRANSTDTQRINMFANHINQFVHLVKPEFPRVFTNFENQVGQYSIAYKKAKGDFKIISKIVKNEFNYDLIVQYKASKIYDILHYRTAVNITEDYGYALEDCIPDKKEGDSVNKDEFVYKSPNYDNDGNFAYGVNLKAIFLPYKNMTYEDGIVISESAAEKLKSFKVEQTMFSINSNDVLLNLYGDSGYYKSFPRIGEVIDSRILVALRRLDYGKILYDFQSEKMRDIDSKDDTVIYTGGGKIVDIEVYSNIPLHKLKERSNEFRKEIIEVYEKQYNYYTTLAKELEKIIPLKDKKNSFIETTDKKGGKKKISEYDHEMHEYGYIIDSPVAKDDNSNKYTDELAYYWKLSHEHINSRIQWRHEGKTFDSFKMRFTILKENPITMGAKLTGRYGNKGTVSLIIPDAEMPETESGTKADIILNPLGIVNRLNLGQIQEQYLNFMGDKIVEKLKVTPDQYEREDILFKYLKIINKQQYDFLDTEYIMLNKRDKEIFFEDIIQNGLYTHQTPFFGNTTMEQFEKIFREMSDLVEKYKFKGIEKPMVMGDIYFIRLKHESSNKSSARSTALNNIKNLPSKSTLKKEKKVLLSQTPIRLGEMEVTNMMLPKRGDLVEKLLKTYSTSEEDREHLIKSLLMSKTPLRMNTTLGNEYSVNRKILQKYMNVLELDLED